MQQGQELRDDTLYLVCDEYLVAIELDFVTLQVDIRLDTWEVQDTREVEGIIDIQVNPEHRLIAHRVEGTVETLVVLVLQVGRCLGPQRLHIIYNIILGGIHHLLLVGRPLLFLAEGNRNSHELTVLV